MTPYKRIDLVHREKVDSIAFSPDGRELVTAAADLTRWSVPDGQKIGVLRPWTFMGEYPFPKAIAFSPDGRFLVEASSGAISIIDAKSGQDVHVLRGGGSLLSFSRSGQLMALSGPGDGEVTLRDTSDWHVAWTRIAQNRTQMTRVQLSPDGQVIASAGIGSNFVTLWDAATGEEAHVIGPNKSWVWSLAFSPADPLLAVGTNQRVQIWNLKSMTLAFEVQNPTAREVSALDFSPDGQILAVGWSGVLLLKMDTMTQLGRVGCFGDNICVAFSPDGRLVASTERNIVSLDDPLNCRPLDEPFPSWRF